MPAARAVTHTVETLTAEISRIVGERQELRVAGASFDVLEENRRRLAAAQSELSQLLIDRHLPRSASA
jgi:hypothetical protein